MKVDTASRTAQYMALYRAMETMRPASKRLFSDPYAIRFLDRSLRLACQLARWRTGEQWLYRYMQKRIPGALASGLARTRYIDDLIITSVEQGSRQLLVLGAGFDTRSLRLPVLNRLTVVEVDHPATSQAKIKALRTLPPNTIYCKIDFDKQDLRSTLEQQAVNLNIPICVVWEGVTNYLTEQAVDAVFLLCATLPPGSSVIFTYIDKKVLEQPAAFLGAERLLKDLDNIGERWAFGFDPSTLSSYLARFGFRLVEDKGAAEYRESYIPERKTILNGYEYYRVCYCVRQSS